MASLLQMFAKSLRELQTNYIDMMLLHYPECWGSLCSEAKQPEGTWQDRWGLQGMRSCLYCLSACLYCLQGGLREYPCGVQ